MAKKAKKAKAKKAKATKKAPQKKLFALTPSGLKKAGAKPFALPQVEADAVASAGHPDTHNQESVIVAPGPHGTTIVCRFNPNTGNFDDCHTVTSPVGILHG